MPELEPITREEKFLNGEVGMTPITREEKILAGEDIETITRREYFLKKYRGGGGGDVTVVPLSVTENGTYSEEGKAYSPVRVNVSLPQNAYLKKTATTSMSDAVRLPVASAVVSVTDKDKAELFLTSDGVVSEDNTPYTYRQSPSGKSCVDLSVVGGTVAWNQLVQFTQSQLPSNANGITYSYTDGTSFKISGTATAQEQRSGWFGLSESIGFKDNINHKVIICTKIISGTSSNTILWGYNNVLWDWGESNIFIVSDTAQRRFYYRIPDGTVCNDLILTMTAIDLTQAFGSTIADYVYSLEQATAGSGIAWLKANGFFTKDYYAYDSGSLQSVKTSGRKIVGKNIASVNSVTAGSGNIDIYNGIGIQSNITISFKCNNFSFTNAGASLVVIIDSDNQAHPITPSGFGLSANTVYNNRVSGSFTINYKFKRIYIPTTGYTNISGSLDDIQIELGSIATTYEPYNPTTYSLSPIDLRGIPKLDSNNQLYFDGDVYESDGSVKRKYAYVNLGDLNWIKSSQGNKYYTSLSVAYPWRSNLTMICAKYEFDGVGASSNSYYPADKKFRYLYQTGTPIYELYVTDNNYTDAQAFTTAMNGVYLVYELATTTTESATPYTNPQLVDSTEEFIDTRDVAIPVGQDSKYVNGNIYIKNLDSVTTGDIELADENAIIPLENTTYISSNGSASIDYWSKEV